MEDSKCLVSMFVEKLWNERKLELADVIFHETAVRTSSDQVLPLLRRLAVLPQSRSMSPSGLLAFPDLRFTIDQICADGDRMFSQLTMDGTHTGHWLGIPPTGKRINVRMATIHRIQSGRIIEDWVLVESLGVFQQLGALPPTKDFIAAFARRESV